MSQRSKLVGWGLLVCLLTLPSSLFYWWGGHGARQEEEAATAVVARGRQLAIDHALRDERARTEAIRGVRDGLKRDLAANTEAALKRLRKQVEDRRAAITDQDRLLLDPSISLDQLVKRSAQLALPKVAGVEITVERGSRGYELWLRFSADPSAEDLSALAEALSRYPPVDMRSWLRNLYLARPQAHRYPTRLLQLSPEAWRVLLEGYQQEVRTVSATYVGNLYGEQRLGELRVSLSKSVPVGQALTIVGPERVAAQLEPGGTFSRRLAPGNYVLRSAGPTKEEPIWLHLFELKARRQVKFTLEFRK